MAKSSRELRWRAVKYFTYGFGRGMVSSQAEKTKPVREKSMGMQFQKKIRREGSSVLDLIQGIEVPELSARRLTVQGRNQVVCLEVAIWKELETVARRELLSIEELCNEIAAETPRCVPFVSAIRSYVLDYYRRAAALPASDSRLLS